jgi:hypothetical protein
MKENNDLEKDLSSYKPPLRSDLKREVMDRYSRSAVSGKRSWWRRPVPLYQAAAAVILFAAIALFAGAGFLGGNRWFGDGRTLITSGNSADTYEMEPVIAVNSRF